MLVTDTYLFSVRNTGSFVEHSTHRFLSKWQVKRHSSILFPCIESLVGWWKQVVMSAPWKRSSVVVKRQGLDVFKLESRTMSAFGSKVGPFIQMVGVLKVF